jgi:GNAT superfamily N-acetyltransferase
LTPPVPDDFLTVMSDLVLERATTEAALEDWRHVHNVVIPAVTLTMDDMRDRVGRNHLEVAYRDGTLVGNSTVWPPTEDTRTARVIARVLPQHRRQGFGTTLYDRALAVAATMGAQRIGTVVLAANSDGLEFALRRGFVETERYVLPGDTAAWVELERPAPTATA